MKTRCQKGTTESKIHFGEEKFLTVYAADIARQAFVLTAATVGGAEMTTIPSDNNSRILTAP